MERFHDDYNLAPAGDKARRTAMPKSLLPSNLWQMLYGSEALPVSDSDYVTYSSLPSPRYSDYVQYFNQEDPLYTNGVLKSPTESSNRIVEHDVTATIPSTGSDVTYTEARNVTSDVFNITMCSSELVNVSQFAYLYGIGFLVVAALLLNFLSLVIFQAKPLRKFSVSVNFSALAIIDTISLASYLPRKWLNDLYITIGLGEGITFYDSNTIACKSITYLAYVFRFISSWLVVAMICERLVVASNPYKHLKNHTIRMVRHCILYSTISSLIVNAHVIFIWQSVRTSGPGETNKYSCIPIAPTDFISMLLTIATVLSVVGVPFLLVTGVTAVTVRNLSSWKVRPRRMSTNAICKALAEKQATIMVCAVTSVFSLLCVPYVIAWTVLLLQHFVFRVTMCQYVQTAAARDITEVIFLINYVIKFLVCIFAGRNVLNRR